MPEHQITIQHVVRAPRERVFAVFANHARFATLFGAVSNCIEEGTGEAHGFGSVRRIGNGLTSFDETIVAFDKPQRLEYRITRGSPLKNHLGTITFHADGDLTVVDYVISFDSKIPGLGGCMAWLLKRAWDRNGPRVLAQLNS